MRQPAQILKLTAQTMSKQCFPKSRLWPSFQMVKTAFQNSFFPGWAEIVRVGRNQSNPFLGTGILPTIMEPNDSLNLWLDTSSG